jgi:hypothetical protein
MQDIGMTADTWQPKVGAQVIPEDIPHGQ